MAIYTNDAFTGRFRRVTKREILTATFLIGWAMGTVAGVAIVVGFYARLQGWV